QDHETQILEQKHLQAVMTGQLINATHINPRQAAGYQILGLQIKINNIASFLEPVHGQPKQYRHAGGHAHHGDAIVGIAERLAVELESGALTEHWDEQVTFRDTVELEGQPIMLSGARRLTG